MRLYIQTKSLSVLMIIAGLLLFSGTVFAQDSASSGAIDPLSLEGVVAARNAISGGGGVVHDQGNSGAPGAPSAAGSGTSSGGNYFTGGKFETFSQKTERSRADARDSYRIRSWHKNWD